MTPTIVGLPSHNLATRVTICPVSCLTRRVYWQIFESLVLRKHTRVGL